MTKDEAVAYINAQVALFNAELYALQIPNKEYELATNLRTQPADIRALIEHYERIIGHNAILTLFESSR